MSVVIELLLGLVLGNLRHAGVSQLDFLRTSRVVDAISQAAVILLFFRVGLEATVGDLKRVGTSAVLVAACGIAGSKRRSIRQCPAISSVPLQNPTASPAR